MSLSMGVLIAVFGCSGCVAAFYGDQIRSDLAAIRNSSSVVSDEAIKLAERVCDLGSDDGELNALIVWKRCSTLRGALITLGGVRRGLNKDMGAVGFINSARTVGVLAARRSLANEQAWADAIKFNATNPFSESHYSRHDALALVSQAAAACGVDRDLAIRASRLLKIAKAPVTPASYRALAVEVNVAVEMAISPSGSLDTYRLAMASSDQSVSKARLMASAEPEVAAPKPTIAASPQQLPASPDASPEASP